MKKHLAISLLVGIAAILNVDAFAQTSEQPQLVLAFSASSLGFGVQAARPVTRKSDIHAGFNFYNYNRDFVKDGANYSGGLKLRSFNLQYDQYLVAGLHVSAGALFWNGNKGDAKVAVPAGKSFTLGGFTYDSDPANPVSGTAALRFRKVAPQALIGYGNLVSKGRVAYSVDAGAVFQGSPRTTLSLSGNGCLAGTEIVIGPSFTCPGAISRFQSAIPAEQKKINNDLSAFKYYPVIQFMIGYKF